MAEPAKGQESAKPVDTGGRKADSPSARTRKHASPLTISVIGQTRALGLVESMLASGHLPPMLFTGQSGVGKRTTALWLAQAANCESAEDRPCGTCRSCRNVARLHHPDVQLLFPVKLPRKESGPEDIAGALMERYPEYVLERAQEPPDPRLLIPIGAIRWLRTEMARPPLQARQRFYIILHAHRMNLEASNALLKILEEPQAQTTFVLASDSPSQLLDTIRSRCQTVRFSNIPAPLIAEWLVKNAKAEPAEAEMASIVAGGSLGLALRFLEAPGELLVESVVGFFRATGERARNIAQEKAENGLKDAGPGHRSAAGAKRKSGGRAGADLTPLAMLGELRDVPLPSVVGTLLSLYRETLRVKLGLESAYARSNPAIATMASATSLDYLLRAVRYLLGRDQECRLYINPTLSYYTLLSGLHF